MAKRLIAFLMVPMLVLSVMSLALDTDRKTVYGIICTYAFDERGDDVAKVV